MKLQSLSHFLNVRYSLIIGLLVVMFTSLVVVMNESGIDDTIEYYLFYEAESLSSYYQPYDEILEFHQGAKEYYWGKDNLPKHYQALFGDRLEVDKMTLFEHDRTYVYVVPFAIPSAGIELYILHIFPFDEYEESNMAYRFQLQVAAVNFAIILFLLMLKFNRRVTRQIKELDLWVAKLSKPSQTEALDDLTVPDTIDFEELNQAAKKLLESVQNQAKMRQEETVRLQQEKDFLTSLSHELRTPITVIAAAVSLLNKRNELTEKDKTIVQKLAKANNNMGLLTKTLLQVWRMKDRNTQSQPIRLAEKVSDLIAQNAQHLPKAASFEVLTKVDETLQLDPSLVALTVDNLLRNASQYSADGKVECLVEGNKLTVSNAYNQAQQHSGDNYGYGFGLYLVAKICEREAWSFDVQKRQEQFVVTLIFDT